MREDEREKKAKPLRDYLHWRRQSYRNAVEGLSIGFGAAKVGLNAFRLLSPPAKGWFWAQDRDGGRERFERLSGMLQTAEIDRASFKWRREQWLFGAGSVLSLALLPVLWIIDILTVSAAFSLLWLASSFFVLAVRARYRRWQLCARRIGSLGDFFGSFCKRRHDHKFRVK